MSTIEIETNAAVENTEQTAPVAKEPAKETTSVERKPAFALPPVQPTQKAIGGITFDFNYGLRVSFPTGEAKYRCLFRDLDSGLVLYCMDAEPGSMVESIKKYLVRFGLEIYRREQLDTPVFTHDFSLANQDVLLQLPIGALGDTIAWFSYVERFQKQHNCRLFVSMQQELAELFKAQYPEIKFVTMDEAASLKPYATYNIGLCFGGDTNHQPYDFRQIGLHRTAGFILGLEDIADEPPRVDLTRPRQIKEKYAVIATQASSQAKYWNHPSGWREVIGWLKDSGLRVLCIDRLPEYGNGVVWNRIPWGCENHTGDFPLQERIDLIKDAEVFIGLSSGLSWLAWCCQVPVVLISGFTDPINEFASAYRVQNPRVCHGCWNDTRCEFDHQDFLWCPRQEKLEERFECTRAITPPMVIRELQKIIN